MRLPFSKRLQQILLLGFLFAAVYGIGRLYYYVTDGFNLANISSDFAPDSKREVNRPSLDMQQKITTILSQPFTYLGKGCQSYVLLSQDGHYVLKFFKYQRFRHQPWLNFLSFIPFVDRYLQDNISKKQERLSRLFDSWKIAYNELSAETGLVYVHLNKTDYLNQTLTIYDKMGFQHQLDADKMEFLIQRKAQMLCPYIEELVQRNDYAQAKSLLLGIIDLIIREYKNGYADYDHALMQNTGVIDGKPIHIDVGQFIVDVSAKKPEVYKQHLFNKMYRFEHWLENRYPELALFLKESLLHAIGQEYYTMQPHFLPHNEKFP